MSMSKRGIVAAATTAMAALTLAASPARAQSYNNGTPNAQNGNEMTQWIQAEDFTFGGPATLSSVRFWAMFASPGYQGSIVWQIYGNNAGVPGALLFSGPAVPVTALYPGADCVCGAYTGMQLDFALPNINLAAGTYWLGLHDGPLSTTVRDEFYWATTNNNATLRGEEDITPFGDNTWFNNGSEHAFQLNAGAVTPEPASMLLMATGLMGLTGSGLLRRRRKTT